VTDAALDAPNRNLPFGTNVLAEEWRAASTPLLHHTDQHKTMRASLQCRLNSAAFFILNPDLEHNRRPGRVETTCLRIGADVGGIGFGTSRQGMMLIGLLLMIAARPTAADGQGTPTAEVAHADSILRTYVSDGRFSGAVLVARGGVPVYRGAFGLANREWGIPNVPDAKFRIGSVTKSFTAAAILQLVEQGKVSLDAPATTYYQLPMAWSGVTVRQLLSHTSGVPSYTDLEGFFGRESRLDHTPQELIGLTAGKQLDFPPGSKFSYDNSGYVILGAIIARVSGMTYADYLTQHLLAPLGMFSTGYDVDTLVLPKRASGYEAGGGGTLLNAPYISMTVPYAAGGLYSTVDDLNRWCKALTTEAVLRTASEHEMFTDQGHGYGFGWFIESSGARPHIYHGGEVNGFVSRVDIYPADKLTLVVLANQSNAPVNLVTDDLADLFLGLVARVPAPGGKELLTRLITSVQKGEPDYSALTEDLQRFVREKLPLMQQRFNSFGKLRSIVFSHADRNGADRYKVVFDRETLAWFIVIDQDGKLKGVTFGPWM
jgi:D-alanyl-D-alanine carboxypeptidase